MAKFLFIIMMFIMFVFIISFLVVGVLIKNIISLKDYISDKLFNSSARGKSREHYQKDRKNEEIIVFDAEIIKDSFLDKYINEIERQRNNFDNELNNELKELLKVLKNLKSYLQEHRDKEDDIKVLCDYYIPEMMEQLKVYSNISKSQYDSESVERTRKELVTTVKMIKDAFAQILSEFYDNLLLNVSSSLEAIKASIKMKGLSK